jgi:hypothetical protein
VLTVGDHQQALGLLHITANERVTS